MNLLNKTVRAYLWGSLIILVICIPVFYFGVNYVLLRSVDKSLREHLNEIRSNLSSIHSEAELEAWRQLDADIHVKSETRRFSDSLYTIRARERGEHEELPLRCIDGIITVNNALYRVTIEYSLVNTYHMIITIVVLQALLLLLFIAGVLLINKRLSKTLWQPFYSTLKTIQEYELTHHEFAGFKKTGIEEFDAMNKNIEQLLNKNHSIYLLQKEFTENAAHEMQTPLAVFQGQFENLMQTSPLSEEQAGLIDDMEANNQRLIKLNRSLLLLAKMKNGEHERKEQVNVTELIENLAGSFRPILRKKEIKLSGRYNGVLRVHINRSLLEILISNLLSNAERHNRNRGELRIETTSTAFSIGNSGSGKALEMENLYKRFSKQGDQTEGTGLGLSIVYQICQLYKLKLQYHFENSFHIFSIDFSEHISAQNSV